MSNHHNNPLSRYDYIYLIKNKGEIIYEIKK